MTLDEINEMNTFKAVLKDIHQNWYTCGDDESSRIDALADQYQTMQEYTYSGPDSLLEHVLLSTLDRSSREEICQLILKHTVTK